MWFVVNSNGYQITWKNDDYIWVLICGVYYIILEEQTLTIISCSVIIRLSQLPRRRQPPLRNNQPKLEQNWPLKWRHWKNHQRLPLLPRPRKQPLPLFALAKSRRRWSKVHSEHVHVKCVLVLHSVVQRHWLCHGIQNTPASRYQPEIGKSIQCHSIECMILRKKNYASLASMIVCVQTSCQTKLTLIQFNLISLTCWNLLHHRFSDTF